MNTTFFSRLSTKCGTLITPRRRVSSSATRSWTPARETRRPLARRRVRGDARRPLAVRHSPNATVSNRCVTLSKFFSACSRFSSLVFLDRSRKARRRCSTRLTSSSSSADDDDDDARSIRLRYLSLFGDRVRRLGAHIRCFARVASISAARARRSATFAANSIVSRSAASLRSSMSRFRLVRAPIALFASAERVLVSVLDRGVRTASANACSARSIRISLVSPNTPGLSLASPRTLVATLPVPSRVPSRARLRRLCVALPSLFLFLSSFSAFSRMSSTRRSDCRFASRIASLVLSCISRTFSSHASRSCFSRLRISRSRASASMRASSSALSRSLPSASRRRESAFRISPKWSVLSRSNARGSILGLFRELGF